MQEFKWREFVQKFWLPMVVAVVGLGILIYGLWGVAGGEGSKVEIISGAQSSEHSLSQGSELGDIVVDVAGAVVNPGVYKLQSGSRVGDALVMAGGLAEGADRDWVSQTLNLAEVVKDGGKIYIPARQQIGESASQPDSQLVSQKSGKININTASQAELDALVGIGAARAVAIIASRPYANTEELVSKAKIPQSVYDKIRDSISIY